MNTTIELFYFAKLTPQENGFLVTFRDFHNIFTEGDSVEEALSHASEALDGVLAEMQKDNDDIPFPSASQKNEYPVPVNPKISAPILLNMTLKNLKKAAAIISKKTRTRIPLSK